MKKFAMMILAVLMVIGAATAAKLTRRAANNQITPDAETRILRAIDTTCGDTWCCGDYDYRFTRLDAEKGKVTVEFFSFLNYGNNKRISGEGFTGTIFPARKGTCTVAAENEADIHTSTGLTDKFHKSFTACIEAFEAKNPPNKTKTTK